MRSSTPMRVTLLTPHAVPGTSGNAVTVERLARGLARRGVEVGVVALARRPPEAALGEVLAQRPHVLHAFHALHTAGVAAGVLAERKVPLVITLTGTDYNVALNDPERRDRVIEALRRADRLVCFTTGAHDRLRGAAGALPPVACIPQAVWLPDEAPGSTFGDLWGGRACVFLLVAGIRAVKAPLFALAPLERLRADHPEVRFALAGRVLEPELGEEMRRALATRPWCRALGEVPHAAMRSLWRRATIALNTSLSEGMPGAVLEAMASGLPVLASDIEGNRALIRHGETGLLYRDASEFDALARQLAGDTGLRRSLGEAARSYVDAHHRADAEAEAHLSLYREVAGPKVLSDECGVLSDEC